LSHEVYVLGRSDPQSDKGLVPPGATLSFASLDDAGGTVLPFFTSRSSLESALASWPDTDPAFLCLPCRAFFEITQGSRLVLNPNATHGKYFEPEEVTALLEGPALPVDEVAVTQGQAALVGAPSVVPPALPSVLARFFVQRPAVLAAHLGWWLQPDGHQGYLVGIVASDGDAALDGFGQLELGSITDGAPLDVRVFDPGVPDGMLAALPPPFYLRGPQVDVD
jgi:SseB protein N-terminal domain/SseB protein C-terminal domain